MAEFGSAIVLPIPPWVWRLPIVRGRRRAAIAAALREALPPARKDRSRRKAMRAAFGAVRFSIGNESFGGEITGFTVPDLKSDLSAPERPALPPGRQPIATGHVARDPDGRPVAWSRPVPPHAQSAPWSDVHLFPPGVRQVDPRASIVGASPPLALVCIGCELEQAPLYDRRACPYCGLQMRTFGPRVFWWREPVEVEAWTPGDVPR
jgi:hypothetical protein